MSGLTGLMIEIFKMGCYCPYVVLRKGWDILLCLLHHKTKLLLKLERQKSDSEIIKLIKEGCDINMSNGLGKSPLHLAMRRPTIDVALALVKKGANINVQDKEKSTPLHEAVYQDNIEAVCMLLQYGADFTILDKYDVSPIVSALTNEKLEISKVLANYYDDRSSATIEIDVLKKAIKLGHRIAGKILQINGDAFCLECYEKNTFQCYEHFEDGFIFIFYWYKIFRYMLLKCSYALVLEYMDKKFFSSSTSEWLEALYVLLQSSIAVNLTDRHENWDEIMSSFSNNSAFFKNLFYSFYFKKIEQEHRVNITYTCLSLGIQTQGYDIGFVYQIYGFNEELEALLYSAPSCEEIIESENGFISPIPYFILALENNYCDRLICELLKRQIKTGQDLSPSITADKCVVHSLGFFSLSRANKQKLSNLCQNKPEIVEAINAVPEIPSLLELCRNKTRTIIKRRYKVRKPYQFHDIVKSFNLPKRVENVVRFKSSPYAHNGND